ncbi:MAG: ABC transporter permease [Bacteroidales bacterium]
MILSIAWKNIWRNRLRSLIVIIAVCIGMIGGIFSSAIFKGMSESRVEEAIKYEVSHVQIHHPEFLKNQELSYTIPGADSISRALSQLPEVKAVSNRMEMPVMIKSSNTGTGVQLLGIDTEQEKQVADIYKAVYDSTELVDRYNFSNSEQLEKFLNDSVGHYFEKETRYNQIVIGEKLAEQLKVDVKSRLVVNLQSADGSLTGGVFRVGGIYRITNSTFENSVAFVEKDDLAELAGLEDGATNEMAIRLNRGYDPDQFVEKLSAVYPGLSIMSWKDIQPDVGMLTEWLDVMLYVIMIIILLALGFGIVNTMLMVVMERMKELGMLMAIGMNKVRVFSMIMLETIFLSLTGGVAGMIIAAGLVSYYNHAGINLELFSQGFEAIGYNPVLYPAIGVGFYFTITLMIILTAIIASVYPALKALRLRPAEALRIDL